MSDQGRWWKFYTTAPTDPHIQLLDRGDRWSWAALGAYIKVHGEKGVLNSPLSNPILAAFLGVPPESMIETIKRIANVCANIVYEEGKNRHGEFTVTWQKWVSFQEDTTMAKRQQTSRIKRRGEEKRIEEKKTIAKTNGKDHAIKDLLTFYDETYQRIHHGNRPVIGSEDAKAAQTILKNRTPEIAIRMVRSYLEDPPEFYRTKGLYGMRHILSAANTLLARRDVCNDPSRV